MGNIDRKAETYRYVKGERRCTVTVETHGGPYGKFAYVVASVSDEAPLVEWEGAPEDAATYAQGVRDTLEADGWEPRGSGWEK